MRDKVPITAIMVLSLSGTLAAQMLPPAADLPVNVRATEPLVTTMHEMLEGSATFRGQVRLLTRLPNVSVVIQLATASELTPQLRASTLFRRYQYGHIDAQVRVASLLDIPELIAHELEHVLEFAEGTRYRTDALRRRGTVWASAGDRYETARAVAVGRQVAEEVANYRRQLHRRTRAPRVVRRI